MKNLSKLLIITSILIVSCSQVKQKQFTNPIIAGYYPDPSICKVGSDYYLINSTFSYFPGIPIFHSKDLVNWELIGHVLERNEQMDAMGLSLSRGIFAPAISYHEGIFYVTCTLVGKEGNFVVTATNPAGDWSDPYWLPEVNGIDPSLFFDDGETYIVFNSDAPDFKPLYEGHRTIRAFKFDKDSLRVVGEEHLLINGGTDLSKKPVWIEGPHIYKQYDHYYLMAAEGGTAEDHSQVIFRSKSIFGPYESYKNNPILTQRHLNPKREYPVTSTGHADLVKTDSGEWWAVFLGCRPYRPFEENNYNMGRETFMAPVRWVEEKESPGKYWPVINPDFEEVQYYYNYPDIDIDVEPYSISYSGNFNSRFDFNNNQLHKNFIFLRQPENDWYKLTEEGSLSMKVRPEMCSEFTNPSFIAHRQQHTNSTVSTSMIFNPKSENEKAGLVLFQNEDHYYFLCESIQNGAHAVQLYKSTDSANVMELIESIEIVDKNPESELKLQIESNGQYCSFYYSMKENEWLALKENVDGTFIKSDIPRDFVGAVYAMYATSLGNQSDNIAKYNWFEYSGYEEVYNK